MSELKRRLFKVVGDTSQGEGSRTEPIEEIREGIAQLLKQTRERYGQSLRDVSANLRIRMAYLQAIENGRFRELPGPTYAVGFVRSYAEYLGLDSAEIVRRFKGEVEGLDSRTHLAFPEPVPEGKVPGGAIIVVSLLVLVIGYGGWYAITSRDADGVPLIPRLSENLKTLVGQNEVAEVPGTGPASEAPAGVAIVATPVSAPSQPDPATVAGEQTPAATEPPQAGTAATLGAAQPANIGGAGEGASAGLITAASSAADPAASSDTPAPAEAAAAGASAEGEVAVGSTEEEEAAPLPEEPATLDGALPAAPALPEAPGPEIAATVPAEAIAAPIEPEAPAGSAQVRLHARLASWIQISDSAGRPVVTRTMAAGEVLDVPAQPGLTLFTGNAGGLEIVVDGRPLPPLGAVGAVRRGIQLDPASLRAAPAVE